LNRQAELEIVSLEMPVDFVQKNKGCETIKETERELYRKCRFSGYPSSAPPIKIMLHYFLNRDSTVGTTTDFGLDGRGVRVPNLVAVRFSSLLAAQTGSVDQPGSCTVDTGGGDSFSVGKADGAWSYHSTPTSAELKNTWISTSTPPYTFMQ
jgi:hypothetical protein